MIYKEYWIQILKKQIILKILIHLTIILLNDDDIINYSLDDHTIKISITHFLYELENITRELYSDYFSFVISDKINELETNIQFVNKKARNDYYHKYLKYKKKYLELKKKLNN